MYPQCIRNAQIQIDAIVGPDRLPTFADRPHLPYVLALVRGKCSVGFAALITYYSATETLRWRPSVRFGVAHKSTADDIVEYNGEHYFIPAGATIFPVTW